MLRNYSRRLIISPIVVESLGWLTDSGVEEAAELINGIANGTKSGVPKGNYYQLQSGNVQIVYKIDGEWVIVIDYQN